MATYSKDGSGDGSEDGSTIFISMTRCDSETAGFHRFLRLREDREHEICQKAEALLRLASKEMELSVDLLMAFAGALATVLSLATEQR